MKNASAPFVPAAHSHALTPYYGAFMTLFFKKHYLHLSQSIELKLGEKLLDVGCGPGNLLELIQKKHPQNALTGLDVDPEILKLAEKKLPQIKFHASSATHLPEPDNAFNVVTSTLMFHHLDTEEKKKMLQEVSRVLKPGGRFYLFDFSKPDRVWGRWFVKLFHKVENGDEALEGKYKSYLQEAGFVNIQSAYRAHGVMELLVGMKA